MTEMLDRGGMKMRKWLSNDPEVLEDVPQSDKATFLDINGKETLPCQKALGILWLAEEDVITMKPRLREGEYPATRRGMLRCIAALFDPVGLVDPFRIIVWILFQRTWIRKEDWDSPLEEDLALEWSLWKKELPHLDNIRVSRHLGMNTSYQTKLHVFSDASKDAFSAVVYARTLMTDGRILVRLVIAKTRLSPLKAISIARVELCGAVIGTRLVKKVIKPLESGRGAKQLMVTYWTVSMNVLFWICRPGKQFKPYVANRVGEIQERTSTDQWRHIPTKLNPADISSRGMAVEELARSQLWWESPSFLKESESNWPEKKIAVPDETTDIEKTSTFAVQEAQPEQNETMMFPLHPSRWSDMGRLTRRIGFVRRIMMWLLKRPLPPGTKTWIDELSPEEYRQAEDCLSRQAQKDVFGRELKDLMAGKSLQKTSHLIPLSPYLDKERRLLRIKSRLERIDYISEEEKYPIIMPRKHPVSQLLVKRAHDAVGHPAGPFLTKQGRGKIRNKRYLAVFTCLQTRAVHLEPVYQMDTDSFLMAFARMTSRRSVPEEVLTDNGSNFVAGERELRELVNAIDWTKVQQKTLGYQNTRGVTWHLNPPGSPHFGGVFEIMVKAAKRALKISIDNADINDEEFHTFVVDAEGLLNSRPLTPPSSDPEDQLPLTPNHFLHGQLGGQLAPSSTDELRFNPRRRWRRIQDILKQFWQRWQRELLPQLHNRKKWLFPRHNLKPDDILLVIEERLPRGQWKMGRVLEVYPGEDGLVRTAKVKTSNGKYVRPVNRLCPVEFPEMTTSVW
ncbi:uncharacterized protein LOC135494343 [Lineus longissimus]|uniref:uncharacterized protein LOC135494343 n=1 Tax=Lineus longissimus TaxID=88925 RepID=UPI00315D5267